MQNYNNKSTLCFRLFDLFCSFIACCSRLTGPLSGRLVSDGWRWWIIAHFCIRSPLLIIIVLRFACFPTYFSAIRLLDSRLDYHSTQYIRARIEVSLQFERTESINLTLRYKCSFLICLWWSLAWETLKNGRPVISRELNPLLSNGRFWPSKRSHLSDLWADVLPVASPVCTPASNFSK